MPAFVDHYEVLGVAPTATALEIRQAYRRLVALEHADRHGGDATAVARTRDLNLARDVLVDPASRRQFDRQRDAAAYRSDPLIDSLLRNFGATPSNVTVTSAPVATWVHAVATGIVGAAAVVAVAAAAFRAVRMNRR